MSAETWIEWGVRRTWGPQVGSVARMGKREAEHAARVWPAELVSRLVRAEAWAGPTGDPNGPVRGAHEPEETL